MAYFQGYGYSEDFTQHMTALIRQIHQSPVTVRLTVGGDAICSHCPNLVDGSCTSCGKVECYDRAVLDACGLHENDVLDAEAFLHTVRQRILKQGKRPSICGGCQWNELCR